MMHIALEASCCPSSLLCQFSMAEAQLFLILHRLLAIPHWLLPSCSDCAECAHSSQSMRITTRPSLIAAMHPAHWRHLWRRFVAILGRMSAGLGVPGGKVGVAAAAFGAAVEKPAVPGAKDASMI